MNWLMSGARSKKIRIDSPQAKALALHR